jgi:hypothetical protein
MAGEPAETMIGVGAFGLGILLVFAAVKNVPVFGKDGIVTHAIRDGKFPDISKLPPLFKVGAKAAAIPGFDQPSDPALPVKRPVFVQEALTGIEKVDANAANVLDTALTQVEKEKLQVVKDITLKKIDQFRGQGYDSELDVLKLYVTAIVVKR